MCLMWTSALTLSKRQCLRHRQTGFSPMVPVSIQEWTPLQGPVVQGEALPRFQGLLTAAELQEARKQEGEEEPSHQNQKPTGARKSTPRNAAMQAVLRSQQAVIPL